MGSLHFPKSTPSFPEKDEASFQINSCQTTHKHTDIRSMLESNILLSKLQRSIQSFHKQDFKEILFMATFITYPVQIHV
jgi:hypothetical protein